MSYNYTMLGRLCVTFVSNTRFGFNRHGGSFRNFAMTFMFNLVEAFLQVNMVATYYFTTLIHQSVTRVILISFYNSTFFWISLLWSGQHISLPLLILGISSPCLSWFIFSFSFKENRFVTLSCGGYNKNVGIEITLFSVLRYNDVHSDGLVMNCNDVLCCAVISAMDCAWTA